MSHVRRMSALTLLPVQGSRRMPGKYGCHKVCLQLEENTSERNVTFFTFNRIKSDCFGCSLSYTVVKHHKGKLSVQILS